MGWGLLSDLGYSLCLGFDHGLLPTATVKEELTGLGACIMASCRMLGKQRIYLQQGFWVEDKSCGVRGSVRTH